MRRRIAFEGRFFIPLNGLLEALFYALTFGVHFTEITLRRAIACFGGATVPRGRGFQAARHAGSVVVHQAEIELGVDMTGFRQRLPQNECGLVVAAGRGAYAGFEISGAGLKRGQKERQQHGEQLHGAPPGQPQAG